MFGFARTVAQHLKATRRVVGALVHAQKLQTEVLNYLAEREGITDKDGNKVGPQLVEDYQKLASLYNDLIVERNI